jgi:outer membrane protein OmpA-like peptidoglycan-associated protein
MTPGDHVMRGFSDALRVSDAIYRDVKAGKETAFEFDGPESTHTIRKIGEEPLTVLVNDRPEKVRTLKCKTGNGWTIWMLDNPDFPVLLKGEASWKWAAPAFNYPADVEQNLARQLEQASQATTHAILFAFNSAELNPNSKPVLDTLAEFLKSQPALKLQIQGHTDNIGGAAFNNKLSEQRAEAVKAYLIGKGIAEPRLRAQGYGFSIPVADNTTPEGRTMNRRVVFKEIK